MTDKEFIEAKQKELRAKKARCNSVCLFYDHQDHDCDRYGQNHPSPANCGVFLTDCLVDWRNEDKEEKNG